MWIKQSSSNLPRCPPQALRRRKLRSKEELRLRRPRVPRLQMGINRPMRSRLGFCLGLGPFTQEETQAYVSCRWKEVGVAVSPFEEAAQLLLHQASSGMARSINQLSQLAITHAMELNQRSLTTQHVQNAMTHLPWLTPTPPK